MKFREYKELSLTNVADKILEFWEDNDIFNKSITSKDKNKPFIFYEGPPSANGLPGIHHVMARAIKDIFCRYKTLQGFQVYRKAGWDTHGLPVELGVEKELGITKEDIGKKISVEEYNEACKKAVMRYTNVWNDLTKKIGYWVDMEHPYVTYKSKYMESVWWLLAELYKKGLIYKGYTIQPYSPKAGTGLSSHELNQPGTYKDVTDTTVVAQFKIKENQKLPFKVKGDTYFIAWTTTPWTLPSNTALAVGSKIDYVLVKTYNQYTFNPVNIIVAKALIKSQFDNKFEQVNSESQLKDYKKDDKKIPYFIASSHKGLDLLDIKYEQLLPLTLPYKDADKAFVVIKGNFVTTEEGTGIVHISPTFGQDDAQVAKEAGVPPMLVLDDNENPVPIVDLQGRFTKHMGKYAGKYVKNEYYSLEERPEKSLDVEIAIQLKEENKAFKVEKHKHSYPHCWRTDMPILYYALDSWFIKVTEKRDEMFNLNKTINWKPESTGKGRFGNWLKNANDWNLSRSRYWGTPLPIWRTEDGSEEIIIGSIKELKEEMKKSVKAGFMKADIYKDFVEGDFSEENYEKVDLHKNIVDTIVLTSPLGKPMNRESDLIDVWFDSGSMPYSQWHYPFENKDLIDENKFFPANFISEGVDQTRGWFYTLHAIAAMVFDSVAYKNVISSGLVLDKYGKKMSKRLGNAIDPFKVLDKYGPDAIRWYMMVNANPWDNLKFDLAGVDEVRRKLFGTLYNTYSFFVLYANLDKFTYQEEDISINKRPEIDKWILSELNTLIKTVEDGYENYEPTKVARAVQDFVTEKLSNWYVRLSRRRFWKGSYELDKISGYQTLYKCLLTISKLASPIAPFFMDNLYKDLVEITGVESFESVHLAAFPVVENKLINKSLERKMQKAQTIASMVLSLRKKEKIKVRQPLQRIMIPVLEEQDRKDLNEIADLILSEVNVKTLELIDDTSGLLVKDIKPNFKILGPRFGKEIKYVVSKIQKLTQKDIDSIEKEGKINIEINGKYITLAESDVEIISQDIEGWLVTNQGNLTIALDVNITEELQKEGIARELVNRIQNLRKDSGLEVTDKIKLYLQRDGFVENAAKENEEYIKNETLTNELIFKDNLAKGIDVSFDKIKSKLLITKI